MALVSVLLAWLRLFRVGNLPTVWSNVVLGVAVGAAATGSGGAPLAVLLNEAFVLLVAATLSYAGAMAMNGAVDAAVDASERPGRPVPSGAIAQRSALRAGKLGVLAGLALLVVYRPAAVVGLGTLLALCIVLYNALHTRTRWAVLLPAACRGLLVAIAVCVVPGVGAADAAVPAIAVASVVLGISLYARSEAERPGRPSRVGWLLAALPALDAALVWLLTGHAGAAAFCLGCGVVAALAGRFVPGS